MDFTTILGYTAGILIIFAYLPQSIKTIKSKSTKDISILFSLILTIAEILWIIYAIIIHSYPLLLTNAVSVVLLFPILAIKLKNEMKRSKKNSPFAN